MIDDHLELTARLYRMAHSLKRFEATSDWSNVPADGVYLFFERGETVTLDGQTVERIVRVGTHRADGGLKRRLRLHFSGSRRNSAFRRHVGGALLERAGADLVRTEAWSKKAPGAFADVEARVDALLRERFTFCAIPMTTMKERLIVERALIAFLAQPPIDPPAQTWLGHLAVSAAVRDSGLWNVNHTRRAVLREEDIARIAALSHNLAET